MIADPSPGRLYRRPSSTRLTISRHNRSAASAGASSRSVGSGATFRPTITAAGFAGFGLGFLTRRGGRAMTICGLSVSPGQRWAPGESATSGGQLTLTVL
jgi:hypothetical protein